MNPNPYGRTDPTMIQRAQKGDMDAFVLDRLEADLKREEPDLMILADTTAGEAQLLVTAYRALKAKVP